MDKKSPSVPDFSKDDGLLPAIAQDSETGEVLMLAWMNAESFAETVATGEAVYFSRSRGRLWRKGKKAGTFNKSRACTSIAMPMPSCSKCGKPARRVTRATAVVSSAA